MQDKPQLVIVYTTIDTYENAGILSQEILRKKEAACINILGPMYAQYLWQGQFQETTEYGMIIKTTQDKKISLEQTIQQFHPYDCPCFLVLPVEETSNAFQSFILESLS